MLHDKWHKLLLEHRGLEFKTITMIEVRAKDFIYFIKSKLKHDIMTMSIKWRNQKMKKFTNRPAQIRFVATMLD